MKPGALWLLLLLLPACAPQTSTPRPPPSSTSSPSGTTGTTGSTGATGPTANSFSADATDCERQAALAGAGGKAAAFESCMRTRGRTLNR